MEADDLPLDVVPVGPWLGKGSLAQAICRVLGPGDIPCSSLGALRREAARRLVDAGECALRFHEPEAHAPAEWRWLDGLVGQGKPSWSLVLREDAPPPGETSSRIAWGPAPARDRAPWPDHPLHEWQRAVGTGSATEVEHWTSAVVDMADRLGDAALLDHVLMHWRLRPEIDRANSPLCLRAAQRELACGNPNEALRLLEAWRPGTEEERQRRCMAHADVLEYQGEYGLALELLASLYPPQPRLMWDLAARRAILQLRLGQLEQLLSTVAPQPSTEHDVIGLQAVATWHSARGVAYFRLGRYKEARESHEIALDWREQIGHEGSIARSCNNLGNLFLETGDFAHALAAYRQAADRLSEGEDIPTLAALHNNMASLHLLMGSLSDARQSAQRALDMKGATDEGPGLAIAQTTMAAVALAEGRLAEARQWAFEARGNLESLDNIENLPDIAILEGEVLLAAGDIPLARATFLQVLEPGRGHRPTLAARALRGLARIALGAGRRDEALGYLQRALVTLEHSGRGFEHWRTVALAREAGWAEAVPG